MGIFLLGIDLGTTHCKAGLFGVNGVPIKIANQPMQTHRAPDGCTIFDPREVWEVVAASIREVVEDVPPAEIMAVGIASMAESGLLVDLRTGSPRSAIIPWFDPAATPQAEILKRAGDPEERFYRSGIRPNFKCSLAKILWLREQDSSMVEGAVWLNAADYLVYRLAGVMATDYSLAGRTYAFDIHGKVWDPDLLRSLQISSDIFPVTYASGEPVGGVQRLAAIETGLKEGTPVAVCGHDHVCAAFAAGAIEPGAVFDSMGTAEALVGAFPARKLDEEDYLSGLVYGCHVAGGSNYWMGGLSASGGSVEWLRGNLGEPALTYDQLESLLAQAMPEPTGILYFPYLSGSGSPHTDLRIRAAFVGLDASHGRAEFVKAVFEGTAYEVEFIRRRAEGVQGAPIGKLSASGGGTRNPQWMQIKADVSGCAIETLGMPEATLLGAALLAGVGAGVYPGEAEALDGVVRPGSEVYRPDEGRHRIYQDLYERGYLAMQESLRGVGDRFYNKFDV